MDAIEAAEVIPFAFQTSISEDIEDETGLEAIKGSEQNQDGHREAVWRDLGKDCRHDS